MKTLATVLLGALFWQVAPLKNPQFQDFRYVRAVTLAPGARGQQVATVCAELDGTLYAHTQSLRDMRLYRVDGNLRTLVPYALSSSGTSTEESEPATVLNLGTQNGHIVFDLQMPARAYSAVALDLRGVNYLTTARVSGWRSLADLRQSKTAGTDLGTFTLFDLSAQHLGAGRTLPLAESTFPFLHVDLALRSATGKNPPDVEVAGASVPPSREAQTLYTVVAETTDMVQRGSNTVATISLPARVPVERVRFVLDPTDKGNFSRNVQLTAKVHVDNGQQSEPQEQIDGQISRVRLQQDGKEIHQESLSVPGTLGINAQAPATVELTVENGDDKPLALRAVLLEMRQRKLCFDGPASGSGDWPLQLAYGNDEVAAPEFDFARLFQPGQPARPGVLGREADNPAFVAPAEQKSFTERHPKLLWAALLALVAVLGSVAFRSAGKL